jgi:hypothetical protein
MITHGLAVAVTHLIAAMRCCGVPLGHRNLAVVIAVDQIEHLHMTGEEIGLGNISGGAAAHVAFGKSRPRSPMAAGTKPAGIPWLLPGILQFIAADLAIFVSVHGGEARLEPRIPFAIAG